VPSARGIRGLVTGTDRGEGGGGGAELLQETGAGLKLVAGVDGEACLLVQQAHRLVHHGQLLLRGGHRSSASGDPGKTGQVPGQQARGFLRIQALGGDQGFLQAA
jgi:hypothetical protein